MIFIQIPQYRLKSNFEMNMNEAKFHNMSCVMRKPTVVSDQV